MLSHKCWIARKNIFRQPVGWTLATMTDYAISFNPCKGTLLTHVQCFVNQHTQVHYVKLLSWQSAPAFYYSVEFFPFVEPCEVFFKPFSSMLSSLWLAALHSILTIPSQLAVTCELAKIAVFFDMQFNNEDRKQQWPLRNVIHNWMLGTLWTFDHYSLTLHSF